MNFIITGANSGIGLEILKILSKNSNYKFFLIIREDKNIKHFKNSKFYKVDLKDLKKVEKVSKKIIKDSRGKIDVVICNAAQGTFGPVEKIKLIDYKNDLRANFFSNLILIKSFLPFMVKKKYGHIVNIASGTGIFGFENSSSYALGKSNMQILIETIYQENLKNNVYSKNIFPGLTNTNFFKKNKYLAKKYKNTSIGQNKEFIANEIVKNIFSKKINIFCQFKTRMAFWIKIFPKLNNLKKLIS
tara:strand:- start:6758 stop:7492 length:735 start_codon:yes stop_codon:yes gene_type:complete